MKIGDLVTFDHKEPRFRNKMLGVILGHETNIKGRRFYRIAWNNGDTHAVYVGDVELVHTGDHK